MDLHLHQRACHRLGNARNDDGFTVLEVVVAMTIFVIVAVGAAGGVLNGIKASNSTTNRVGGANVAQSDLDQARVQPTPSPTSYATNAPSGGSYTVTRTVTMPTPSGSTACPAGSEMTISVVVTGPGRSTSSVKMQTVVAC